MRCTQQGFPSARMILCLRTHGANPNFELPQVHGTSPTKILWNHFLAEYDHQARRFNRQVPNREKWLDAMTALLPDGMCDREDINELLGKFILTAPKCVNVKARARTLWDPVQDPWYQRWYRAVVNLLIRMFVPRLRVTSFST